MGDKIKMNDYEIQKIRDTAFCSGYNTAVSKYENKIAELERKLEQTEKDLADYQFNYPTIKELQKENAELERKIASIRGCHRVDLAKLKARTEQVERLKKENAGLKSEKGCKTCTKFDEEQLTKAKEIIRDLMSFSVQLCDCKHTVDFEKTREEAEQFLNEVEK